MTSKSSIVNAVEKTLAGPSPLKKRIWFDSCPEHVQAALLEIKRRFAEGKYTSSRAWVARAILATVAEHLPSSPSQEAIERWLAK